MDPGIKSKNKVNYAQCNTTDAGKKTDFIHVLFPSQLMLDVESGQVPPHS